jgi:hypothetical protein
MFPAKYGFDVNATPNCGNDFVVFALNVAGTTGGQANLVGLNQLYRGTGGLCGMGSARVNWGYNGSTAGGKVLTSPGDFTGWDENRLRGKRRRIDRLHVLTWVAGQGTSQQLRRLRR